MPFRAGNKASLEAKYTHHGSTMNLWENGWKFHCRHSLYPFNQGTHFEDFEPIFEALIEKGINDPGDEAWPAEFLPHIEAMIVRGDEAFSNSREEAAKLYLRACSLCHISRYPVLNSPLRRHIWSLQKSAYFKATSTWADPVQSVKIPHIYSAGDDEDIIPVAYRFPAGTATSVPGEPVPVMLLMSGLDGFSIDVPWQHTEFFHARGWAYIAAEIPAGGDCPAAKHDPDSPDRLWSSVLDWIDTRPELDSSRVAVWGYSTGGHYALRAAHTHNDRLAGVVAQGAFVHHCFDEEWLDLVDVAEYYSSLTRSLLFKFGYDSLEEMKKDGQRRFSLVESGILEQPHARMLLLNGEEDTVYPVEDSLLVLQYPGPKEGQFFSGLPHMGEPKAGPVGWKWLVQLLGDNSIPKKHHAEELGAVQAKGRQLIEA